MKRNNRESEVLISAPYVKISVIPKFFGYRVIIETTQHCPKNVWNLPLMKKVVEKSFSEVLHTRKIPDIF